MIKINVIFITLLKDYISTNATSSHSHENGERKKKKKKDGFLRLKAFAVSYGHMLISMAISVRATCG